MEDIYTIVQHSPEFINKYEITRRILSRINEAGDNALRERREIIKRVAEFEDFSTCWPNDQLKAKGLVSQIQKVVNIKDSFTRMKQEAERVRMESSAKVQKEIEERKQKNANVEKIKNNLFSLFTIENPQERGKKLESVLNELFKAYGILVRESFALSNDEGIYEQIDGVVEIKGEMYLVEMKWTKDPVGKDLISTHLVRVYHRGYTRGIFISANSFTEPALAIAKESLQKTVFVLITLDEIVNLLEKRGDLLDFLKEKIDCALIEKIPYKRLII